MNELLNRWKEQYDKAQARKRLELKIKANRAERWLIEECAKHPQTVTDEYIKEWEDANV